MRVAIVGYGAVEGPSMLAYWRGKGAEISVRDEREDVAVPPGVATKQGPDYLRAPQDYDVICRNAAVNPNLIRAANPGLKGRITTVINEFLRDCPTRNVIGVTGTKGKGTTS